MDRTDEINAIAALREPVRRRLYEYVSAAGRAVGRDEAAAATGLGRPLAAFHLDRLAGEGLLEVEFRRLSGRTGPGAGRPNKLYRRADRSFNVQLPRRQYGLAGELMAQAIAATGAPALAELRRVARQRGRELAETAHGGSRDEAAAAILASLGYEPYADDTGVIRLRNCPFRELALELREATCGGMNLALVEGLLEGLGAQVVTARLEVQPARCCVVLAPTGP